MNEAFVPALLEERRGYVIRDLPDRVAAVDVELAKFGVAVDDDGEADIPETVQSVLDAEGAEPVEVVEVEPVEGDDLETTDGKPSKAPARKPAAKKK